MGSKGSLAGPVDVVASADMEWSGDALLNTDDQRSFAWCMVLVAARICPTASVGSGRAAQCSKLETAWALALCGVAGVSSDGAAVGRAWGQRGCPSGISGKPPLYLAAERNNVACVMELLECGANVDALSALWLGSGQYEDLRAVTALNVAVEKQSYDVARVLLAAGATLLARVKDGDEHIEESLRNELLDLE
ncbi:hypothetical protein HDU96_001981 [Phlyctochytrium bullatum]|nr:hypothetical protein HDU96_001981 [Phlyctochytrium bullatum]